MTKSGAPNPIENAIAFVTGGGNGIGAALCRRFAQEGAQHVIVFDRDPDAANVVATEVGGSALVGDVTDRAAYERVLADTIATHGRIDICASNAGVQAVGGEDATIDAWDANWRVNVQSQVTAARVLVPHYLERGAGIFLQTASAGGLLTEIGSAPYSVTKAGAIAFAEWLSIRYRRRGVDVSVLCPAGVETDFLTHDDPAHSFLHAHAISPDDVADAAVRGLRDKRFLIVPDEHAQLLEFFAEKATDYDRYLHLFSRISQKIDRMRAKKDAKRSA